MSRKRRNIILNILCSIPISVKKIQQLVIEMRIITYWYMVDMKYSIYIIIVYNCYEFIGNKICTHSYKHEI